MSFLVYIDRLKDGQTLLIDEKATPDFLEIDEKDLLFRAPVFIKGKAYLTNDHLILQIRIATQALLPCAICNNFFDFPIVIEDCLQTEAVEDVENHIFNFTPVIREAILLQVPAFAECHEGKCPERKTLSNYLKKPSDLQNHVNYPFNNL